jgi:hypothetical protein
MRHQWLIRSWKGWVVMSIAATIVAAAGCSPQGAKAPGGAAPLRSASVTAQGSQSSPSGAASSAEGVALRVDLDAGHTWTVARGSLVDITGGGFASLTTVTIDVATIQVGEVRTDEAGTFSVVIGIPADLPLGPERLTASGTGPSGAQRHVTVPLDVTASSATRGGAASISGTVLAAAKGPVGGVCVQAYQEGAGTAAGEAVTDSNGAYRITGLTPGSYVVRFGGGCGASNYPVVWWSGTPFMPSVGASSMGGATTVVLSPGGDASGRDVILSS